MKTLMKTIGILSFLFVLFTVASCEKNDDELKPDKKEQLFALATRVVAPDTTGKISIDDITKGVIVGTKTEMEAYIDRLIKAEKNAEGDNPPEPQAISVYSTVLQSYHKHGPFSPFDPSMEGPCKRYYEMSHSFVVQQYQQAANEGCYSISIDFICPYNDATYTFTIRPNNGCNPGPPVIDGEVAYKGFELTKYPFGIDDDNQDVGKFIESLSKF